MMSKGGAPSEKRFSQGRMSIHNNVRLTPVDRGRLAWVKREQADMQMTPAVASRTRILIGRRTEMAAARARLEAGRALMPKIQERGPKVLSPMNPKPLE
jgi:hypothetical protein